LKFFIASVIAAEDCFLQSFPDQLRNRSIHGYYLGGCGWFILIVLGVITLVKACRLKDEFEDES